MRAYYTAIALLCTLLFFAAAEACTSNADSHVTTPSEQDSGDVDAGPIASGHCGERPPTGALVAPAPPVYSGGTCPKLTTGPDAMNTITSGGVERQFMVVIPDDVRPGEKLPLVFLYYWLSGSAAQLYTVFDAQNAVNQERAIAVIPEAIGTGISMWRGWFPGNPESQEEDEFLFFDDMLACVSEQFPVDPNCVATAGASDGALWSSQLIGGRGQYLSSAIILSGGVSDGTDANAALVRTYIPAPHAMPVLVLWGGPNDICVILKFETATKELEKHLADEGHFVVECQTTCGHAVPALEAPPGRTVFAPFFDFVKDHPYWLTPGHSPYDASGLPADYPSFCAVGIGNAEPPPAGEGCSKLGCPVVAQ
jgi:hypothetical protein